MSQDSSTVCCQTLLKNEAIRSLDSNFRFLVEMTVTEIETINPILVKYEEK